MSRRHFVALAWELRQRFPQPGLTSTSGLGSDWYAGNVHGWEAAVLAAADACAAANGAFDRERFLRAAGYQRRPDGSMYPMAAPR